MVSMKTSRYEILAILRESSRVKSTLDIYYNNMRYTSQIKDILFDFFSIHKCEMAFPTELQCKTFSFIIHSQLGKIEFLAELSAENNSGKSLTFLLPESVCVIQRRTSQRINVRDNDGFYCSGRHRSGENFKFSINDLSEGGCSFITGEFNNKFIDKGLSLDFVEFVLSDYGSFIGSVNIINVVPFHPKNSYERDLFRISCKFKYKNNEQREIIEDLILKIAVDNVIKKRRY